MSLNEFFPNFVFIGVLIACAAFLTALGAINSVLATNKRAGCSRFPPAISVVCDQSESMEIVHNFLLQEDFGGCNWKITDEDPVKSCIRAVLSGTPPGAAQRTVEILLCVFFGDSGASQTRVEWSFVVNCGIDKDVNSILKKTNLVFEKAFSKRQISTARAVESAITNSLARQDKLASMLLAAAEKAESPTTVAEAKVIETPKLETPKLETPKLDRPIEAPSAPVGDPKKCPTCDYALDAAFSFCLHCGASV